MSYSSLNLDFSDWDVVCLSGRNGSGKSSLLDAMTWALWEKARTNDSDQLIRLGEKEMSVKFTFRLEENVYQILRMRQKNEKGGQSILELQVLNENSFSSLTGKGIRDTQKKINEIMRMDYQTFINSSFILQGRVDEFTTKTPIERKKILSEILGLDIYDKLQDLAKKQRDQLQNEILILDEELKYLNESLLEKENIEESISVLEQNLTNTKNTMAILEEEIKLIENTTQQLRMELAGLEIIEQHLKKLLDDIESLNQEITILNDKIDSCKNILSGKDEIETGYLKWKEFQEADSIISVKWEKYIKCDGEIQQLKQEIDIQHHQIELNKQKIQEQLRQLNIQKTEQESIIVEKEKILRANEQLKLAVKAEQEYIKLSSLVQDLLKRKSILEEEWQKVKHELMLESANLQMQIEHYSNQAQNLPSLYEQQKEIESKLSEMGKLEVEIEWITEKGISFNNAIESLHQKILNCQNEIKNLTEKIEQLTNNEQSHCPFCETNLTAEEKEKILKKYHGEIMGFEIEISDNNNNIITMENERDVLRQRYQTLKDSLKDKDNIQQKLGEINQNIYLAQKAQQEIESKQIKLNELEQKMENGDIGRDIKTKLKEINKQLECIDYNPAQLALLQAKVADWKWAEIKLSQLEQTENKLVELNKVISSLQEEENTLKAQLENELYAIEQKERLKYLEQEVANIGYSIEEHQSIRQALNEYQEYNQKWQDLQQALTLQNQLESLLKQKIRLEDDLKINQEKSEKIPALEQKFLQIDTELIEKTKIFKELQNTEKDLSTQLAVLHSKLEKKSIELQQKEQKTNFKNTLSKELTTYTDLVMIFGKNGIQAVIIENALPEIENDTNILLSKLTEGRMHVTIETQKESKTTDRVSETLDIFISDELGTRNYELYSGGEMFRINFAIRLALSKLLARRAGSRLETLVIDEGFGTQDSQGQSRLIEIINTISNDFAKIIIITHVQELKEFFPRRIEIIKQNNNSQLLVFNG